MKKSKEEINAQLKAFIGDNTSDEAISLLEDINDSMDEVDVSSYEKDIADLTQKVLDTEAEWRNKYISRFGESNGVPASETETNIDNDIPEEDAPEEVPSMEDIVKIFI